jgi:hypothetical protein
VEGLPEGEAESSVRAPGEMLLLTVRVRCLIRAEGRPAGTCLPPTSPAALLRKR